MVADDAAAGAGAVAADGESDRKGESKLREAVEKGENGGERSRLRLGSVSTDKG